MAVNTAVFVLYGIDKSKAKSKKWRVPEKTLLWAAVLGPIGALAGMRVFRHKTKKPVFFITVPLIFLAEAAAAVYFIFIKN
ncbi:MAG: DUF1294 domain-containing protein [Ruminococcus sp.]|nr:DUF1294 domain-containing protein [Ruminococcus sp.]